MIIAETLSPDSALPPPADPTIEVAERQLAMLGELGRTTMELSRAYAASGFAAAHAVEVILADEFWQPETGRARALAGARDAAGAFAKVSRSLRLTLAMERAVAAALRDLRAGVVSPAKATGEALALQGTEWDRRRPAGSDPQDETPDAARGQPNTERLYEFDRPDRLPAGAFDEVVDGLRADIGAAPDCARCKVARSELRYEPLKPRPPGATECRPPGSRPANDAADGANVLPRPPP